MTHRLTNQEFFDAYMKIIGSWSGLVHIHRNAASTVKELGCKTVLELGSGIGPFLVGADEVGLTATGVDINELMQEYAYSKGISKERYEVEDLVSYKIKEKVDCIYCAEVFEHMLDEELVNICQQLASNCTWFYFTSTPHKSDQDEQIGHCNVKSMDQWVEFFSGYGFEFIRVDTALVPWGLLFKSKERHGN